MGREVLVSITSDNHYQILKPDRYLVGNDYEEITKLENVSFLSKISESFRLPP